MDTTTERRVSPVGPQPQPSFVSKLPRYPGHVLDPVWELENKRLGIKERAAIQFMICDAQQHPQRHLPWVGKDLVTKRLAVRPHLALKTMQRLVDEGYAELVGSEIRLLPKIFKDYEARLRKTTLRPLH